MGAIQYVPRHQLKTRHIGKPVKLILINGKTIYGVIKEIHQNGIVFIPAQKKRKKNKANAKWFLPIFIPFFIIVPFFFFF